MFNGNILRDAIISAANNIANQKNAVDDLNVFPVPDGDTGTNMSMSIGNAARELLLFFVEQEATQVLLPPFSSVDFLRALQAQRKSPLKTLPQPSSLA